MSVNDSADPAVSLAGLQLYGRRAEEQSSNVDSNGRVTVRRTRYSEANFEMHEILIVRAPGAAREPCYQCLPAIGAMVSPEAAASLNGMTVRALFRCIEAGLIHYREVEDGAVLVCINSLTRWANSYRLKRLIQFGPFFRIKD